MPGGSTEFYVVTDDPDGFWEPRTVRWHAAQEGILGNIGGEKDAVPLAVGLKDFSQWLRYNKSEEEGSARLWTHATFNMPQLQAAYDRAGLRRAWSYRNCRDLRTLYDLAGGRPKLERIGQHHNALNDAHHQMREIQACLRMLQQ